MPETGSPPPSSPARCQTFLFIATWPSVWPTPQTRAGVILPVGFVRQNHKTCGPATLAAIGQFWHKPAEHLEIAAEICYDGTPAASEPLGRAARLARPGIHGH